MLGDRKKRNGSHGTVQWLASTAVIAILAVSPAIVPMANPHLDGIGHAITEAIFGEPVYAQEPPCEPPVPCIVEINAEYLRCLERNPWYLDGACWVARQIDILSCAIEAVTG